MGTITQRQQKDGSVRYRAEIRINKDGAKFSQSKTFSRKALAVSWLKQREAELEANPQLLHKSDVQSMTLSQAIEKYLSEVQGRFERTWILGLKAIGRMPIGRFDIEKLTAEHFSNFAKARLNGLYEGFNPILPQTLTHDFVQLRAVLVYAETVWGLNVDVAGFEKVVRGLKSSRQLARTATRNRLPTSDELIKLTEFFYHKFKKRPTAVPMHLIIWFAIYTARRQEELARLRLSDLHDDWWQVRDMKNPNGSRGNHHHFLLMDKAKAMLPLFLDADLRQNQRQMTKAFDDDLLLPISSKNISQRFTESCKMLGIDDLHFHDLRHEACTRLAESGMTIPQIQQISCHESWSSLQRYVNMKPRQKVVDFDEIMADLA